MYREFKNLTEDVKKMKMITIVPEGQRYNSSILIVNDWFDSVNLKQIYKSRERSHR